MAEQKEKYVVLSRDFAVPLVRNEVFPLLATRWTAQYGLPLVDICIKSEKGVIDYCFKSIQAQKVQQVLYDRMMDNPSCVLRIIRDSEVIAKKLLAHTQRIHAADLSKWSVARLEKACKTFLEFDADLFGVGTLLVVIDSVFGPACLEAAIRDSLASCTLSKRERAVAFEAITAPAHETYAREQERELCRIYRELLKSPRIAREFVRRSPDSLVEFVQKYRPLLAA